MGARHVIVDLGEAEMVDSAVLWTLKRLAVGLRTRGSSLSVVCSHRGLASLLELTLLTRAFPVFGSLDEALEQTGR
jgi:anti-anti-sigma regulatory factor